MVEIQYAKNNSQIFESYEINLKSKTVIQKKKVIKFKTKIENAQKN